MSIKTESIENLICDICNRHTAVLKVPFRDQRGFWDSPLKDLYLCEDCLEEFKIYDAVIHDEDTGWGTKFRKIREKYKFRYQDIEKIVEDSTWGKVRESSNSKKVVKRKEWKAADNISEK